MSDVSSKEIYEVKKTLKELEDKKGRRNRTCKCLYTT